MDEAIKRLFERLPPNFTLFIGLVAFLVVLSPHILNLIQSLKEFRFGKKQAEIEKLSWEILKIRYDIEILKKEHQISLHSEIEEQAQVWAREPKHFKLRRTPADHVTRALEAQVRPWNWLRVLRDIHPVIPRIILALCIGAFGFLGLGSVMVSISFLFDLNKPPVGNAPPTTLGLVVFMFIWSAFLVLLSVTFLRQRFKLKAFPQAPTP